MTVKSSSGPRRGTNDLLIEMCHDIADAYADIIKRRRRSHPKPSPDLVMDTRDALRSALALLGILSAQEGFGLEDLLAELDAALGELARGRVVPLLCPSGPTDNRERALKLSSAERQLRFHAALAAEFGSRAHRASGAGAKNTVKAALDEVAEYLARKSGYRVTAKQVEEFRKRLRNARRDDARARERTAEYLAAVQRAAASAKGIQARIDGTRDKKLRHALGAELAAYWRRQQKGELRIAATCFLRVKAA